MEMIVPLPRHTPGLPQASAVNPPPVTVPIETPGPAGPSAETQVAARARGVHMATRATVQERPCAMREPQQHNIMGHGNAIVLHVEGAPVATLAGRRG